MKALGVYLSNFGSFWGRHYIPLMDRGVISVRGQNLDDPEWSPDNGSGKSTWTDAIDWCLFGVHPRGATTGSVVNEQAQKDCCVSLQLVDDQGRLILIQRFRDWGTIGSGLRMTIDGVSHTALDVSETQRRIEEVIGLDRVVFHCAVLFGQEDDFSFADATDGQRKEVLVRIIPELGEVDRLQQLAEQELEGCEANLVALKGQEQNLAGRLSTLLARNPEPKIAEWEQWRLQQINTAMNNAAMSQKQASDIRQTAVPPTSQLAPEPSDHAYQAAKAETTRAWTVVSSAGQTRSSFETQVKIHKDRLHQLSMTGEGACAACGQTITAGHIAAEQQRAQAALDALMVQCAGAKSQEDGARAFLLQCQQAEQSAHADLSAARRMVQQHNDAVRTATEMFNRTVQRAQAEADSAIRWETTANQYRSAVNPNVAEHQRWQQDVAALHTEQTALSANVATQEARVSALRFWKTGFGAKGLKSILLDSRVDELSSAANQWVQFLTRGTVWVTFQTQREVSKGKQKKLVEDLTIVIQKSNADGTITRRDFRNWSGGEKYRVARAIDFGLSRLVAQRAQRVWDLLILDEAFRGLDAGGKRHMAEMLAIVAREKSSIFVIDHDVFFQHQLAGQMTVRKQNRRSRVLEGMFYGEGSQAEGGASAPNVLADNSAFPG